MAGGKATVDAATDPMIVPRASPWSPTSRPSSIASRRK
jgi:hypothetical protein